MFSIYFKEIIIVCANVATLVSIFMAFKGKIAKVEASNKSINKVLFKDGTLKLVSNEVCKERRWVIKEVIREEKEANRVVSDKLECMNQNLIILLTHMNLEPIRLERRK